MDLQNKIEKAFALYLQTPDAETDAIPKTSFPGGIFVAKVGDQVVKCHGGYALRYSDREGHNLPTEQWIAMTEDKIFDIASITKIWVTVCFLILQKEHDISNDTPVHTLLPGFLGENDPKGFDKKKVLVWHIMAHCSGFTPEPTPMLDTPELVNLSAEKQRESVIHNSLVSEPGTAGVYSDVNYMILGFIIEEVSGMKLDKFLMAKVVEPMGLKDTCYNPAPSLMDRIVANEYIAPGHELGRPQPIRGFVHDDKAHALGGVAGHAGIFSTINDQQQFCEMLLNKGVYKGKQIVDGDMLEQALKSYTTHIPNWNRGLGFELNAESNMGAFVSLPGGSYGHTGFTGTNFAMNDATKSYFIFFANRTHPQRELGSINPARRELAKVIVDYINQL